MNYSVVTILLHKNKDDKDKFSRQFLNDVEDEDKLILDKGNLLWNYGVISYLENGLLSLLLGDEYNSPKIEKFDSFEAELIKEITKKIDSNERVELVKSLLKDKSIKYLIEKLDTCEI